MSIQLPPIQFKSVDSTTAPSGPARDATSGINGAGDWKEGMAVSPGPRSSGTVGADLFRRAFADQALGKILGNCLNGLDKLA